MLKLNNIYFYFNRYIIILFISGAFHENIFSQENDTLDSNVTYSYDTLKQKKYVRSIPWRNSPFISINYNYPLFNKFELGQNISSFIAFGASITINDNWSNTSYEPKIGFFIMIKTPFYKLPFTPYLYFNKGATFRLFSEDDKYTQLNLGGMIKIFPCLFFRPEIGYCQTNRNISGGQSMFGGYTPIVSEIRNNISFNIGIEFNPRGCLKKYRLPQK